LKEHAAGVEAWKIRLPRSKHERSAQEEIVRTIVGAETENMIRAEVQEPNTNPTMSKGENGTERKGERIINEALNPFPDLPVPVLIDPLQVNPLTTIPLITGQ